ncbi:hypothetical protein TELCIR_25690, partial [Teladorsagia circumcincta]
LDRRNDSLLYLWLLVLVHHLRIQEDQIVLRADVALAHHLRTDTRDAVPQEVQQEDEHVHHRNINPHHRSSASSATPILTTRPIVLSSEASPRELWMPSLKEDAFTVSMFTRQVIVVATSTVECVALTTIIQHSVPTVATSIGTSVRTAKNSSKQCTSFTRTTTSATRSS